MKTPTSASSQRTSRFRITLWTAAMCDQLVELTQAMRRYVAGLDQSLLSCTEAATLARDAAVIEAAAATLKALAAARAAERGDWKEHGHRSAAEALARQTGSSVASARDVIDTGTRLNAQPGLAGAARRGELSFAQTSVIANAADADPAAEKLLLEKARESSLAELKDEAAGIKAAACADLEARRRAIHQRRSLRSWTDVEGIWHLAASGNPEDGAQVMTALAPVTDEIFHEARTQGHREHPSAYAFDALVRVAREATGATYGNEPDTDEERPTSGSQVGDGAGIPNPRRTLGSAMDTTKADRAPHSSEAQGSARTRRATAGSRRRGPPVKLLLRVDYDTFLRGAPLGGETCELVGYGPIAVSAVKQLLQTGEPFVAAVLTKGKALVGVAHLGRKPTAHQQTALEWLYPSCAVKGCPTQARLERDHRVDWSKSGVTMLDLLDLLCPFHHGLKTTEGWALVEGVGKRGFVSPDDPRHPRHGTGGVSRLARQAASGPRP